MKNFYCFGITQANKQALGWHGHGLHTIVYKLLFSLARRVIVNSMKLFHQSHGYIGILLLDRVNKSGQLGKRRWDMCFMIKAEIVRELG